MAELPDLTVFAGILSRKFAGKKLNEVDVKISKKLNVSIRELKSSIEGKKLNVVTREGKTLQLHFSGGTVLGIHLMLRGELMQLDKDSQAPKFEIISFHFSGGIGFSVVDGLKQATPTLDPAQAEAPDALEMTFDYFSAVLEKKRRRIKEIMMDQKLMRGIGNSYADEILWHAKISPFSVSNAIPEKMVKKLFKSMREVLDQAIRDIALENGDELHGELRDFMKVHSAKLKLSPTGAKIKSEKIGGRQAYYTDEQELFN
jgi:formamidopyrimidine-DNA glycosylase